MKKTLSQRCWEWIKKEPDFHTNHLAKEMDIELKQAQMVISHLVQLGAVRTKSRRNHPALYEAVKGVEPHLPGKNPTSPQPKSARQRIWQAMRFYGKFTIPEIQSAAECSRSSVERFLTDLKKYGYVKVARKPKVQAPMAERKGNFATYVLWINTGAKYPVMSDKGLRDQNLNKLVPLPVNNSKEAKKCNG